MSEAKQLSSETLAEVGRDYDLYCKDATRTALLSHIAVLEGENDALDKMINEIRRNWCKEATELQIARDTIAESTRTLLIEVVREWPADDPHYRVNIIAALESAELGDK